ncbi:MULTISPECIES: zinc ribbon domain-containing protein [unclassified Methanoregula]|uniref:zinc ribbon domain-containing protein n=1 Tax=unclassified Methanoregula TaxID=2649730 RepID=UPI0025D4D208|nr:MULTISPECIES: zinc ribbon domain-containing protein [unclassified Methanoregula]
MTKTCAQCGHAGLDDHALFCNRCGAPVPEEKKPAFPVCPGCGTVVSDELAQFCNRCGTRILPVPVVCSTCGSPAIDSHSRFCTRCGTTFEPKPVARSMTCPSCGAPDPSGQSLFCNRCGSSFSRPAAQILHQPNPAPVVITQRKQAAPAPLVIVPESDWEPWSDVPPAHTSAGPAAPPAQPEPLHHDQQIAMPQKRYSHLPLVADEMRKKPAPSEDHQPHDIAGLPPRKKSSSSGRKGVLGFLNKK